MAGVTPDEARQFHEEDEDQAKVFAIFDAARRQGRLKRTAPPEPQPGLVPLRELLTELAAELRREGRELQLRERLALWLESVARALKSRDRSGGGRATRR